MSEETSVKPDCVCSKCTIASHAIHSALLSWGHAWTKLDVNTRRAYLMLSIVKYLSGQQSCATISWQTDVPWTAKDCWDILSICEDWSHDGKCGANLARMAEPQDERFVKMFTDAYGYPYE